MVREWQCALGLNPKGPGGSRAPRVQIRASDFKFEVALVGSTRIWAGITTRGL